MTPSETPPHLTPVTGYSIELSERVNYFTCAHCGEKSVTVWGSISKHGAAFAVYYANLMTGHSEASARLTISFGGWGEKTSEPRTWVFIEARPTIESYEMMVRAPEESLYFGKELLGRGLSREEVLASELREEFFAVADYIAFNDPAVKSYLSRQPVSSAGRPGQV